jgi:hypothetical protein
MAEEAFTEEGVLTGRPKRKYQKKGPKGIEFSDGWRDDKTNMADLGKHCEDCLRDLGQDEKLSSS